MKNLKDALSSGNIEFKSIIINHVNRRKYSVDLFNSFLEKDELHYSGIDLVDKSKIYTNSTILHSIVSDTWRGSNLKKRHIIFGEVFSSEPIDELRFSRYLYEKLLEY